MPEYFCLVPNWDAPLGTSIQRQLVLAGYQLCTQVYPQAFLQLSYRQREQLQQDLRHLGEQIHGNLGEILREDFIEEPEPEVKVAEFSADEETDIEQELLEVFESIDQEMEEDSSPVSDGDKQLAVKEEEKERRKELSQLAEHIAESLSEMMQASPEDEVIEDDSPEQLVQWYKTIEKRLRQVLNKGSQDSNRRLQKAQMLPEHLPAKVLDMAIQANRHPNANANQKLTNLVNVVIEANVEGKKKKRTRVTAIHLKVAELEFNDAQVIGQRSRIREQLAKIKQLKKYYKQAKRDLAIAEAEAAWRSSWHEGDIKSEA